MVPNIVMDYARLGVMVIPLVEGAKKPMCAYAHRRGKPVSVEDVTDVWEHHSSTHMAIDCGIIEVLDVDRKNSRDFDISADIIEQIRLYDGLFEKLRIESTETGGLHVMYLVPENEVGSSTMLAAFAQEQSDEEFLNDSPIQYKPVVEICATGHLCRIYPTPGIRNVNDVPIQYINAEEREYLRRLGASYNEKPAPAPARIAAPRLVATSERPGDKYSAECDLNEIISLMEDRGWHAKGRGGRILLTRPNAKTRGGVDADILISKRTLLVYSTSVEDFEPGRGYSMFDVLVKYRFGGDASAAAKWLSEVYDMKGAPLPSRVSGGFVADDDSVGSPASDGTEEELDKILADALSLEMKHDNPPNETFCVHFVYEDNTGPFPRVKKYALGSTKMIMTISGGEKSRKTVVACAVAASALCGDPVIGFHVNISDRPVLFMDTEQPNLWAWHAMDRILAMSKGVGLDRLRYFALRGERDRKRRFLMARKLVKRFNPSVIVIDGATDLVENYNDNIEAANLLSEMSALSVEHDALVVAVIHINRGDKTPRGHVGTELVKKSDIVLRCQKSQSDKNFTDCAFTETRGDNPPAFSFGVHGNNIPFLPGSSDDPALSAKSSVLHTYQRNESFFERDDEMWQDE